jgi:hypothetical protein
MKFPATEAETMSSGYAGLFFWMEPLFPSNLSDSTPLKRSSTDVCHLVCILYLTSFYPQVDLEGHVYQ